MKTSIPVPLGLGWFLKELQLVPRVRAQTFGLVIWEREQDECGQLCSVGTAGGDHTVVERVWNDISPHDAFTNNFTRVQIRNNILISLLYCVPDLPFSSAETICLCLLTSSAADKF